MSTFTKHTGDPESGWSPSSWKDFPLIQHPQYPHNHDLERVTEQLKRLAPLLPIEGIQNLRQSLLKVLNQRGFIMQLGDCVEMFHKTDSNSSRDTLLFFANVATSLQHHLKKPVTTMARMAGQLAKPRSLLTETVNNVVYPSFHGEIVNGFSFDQRTPDPNRMLRAYDVCRFLLQDIRQLSPIPFVLGDRLFTHHEAYLLPYEEGLCRLNPDDGLWYDTSAHSVWVGNWTIGDHTAHIEFVRGIANPVGFKLGPTLRPEVLRRILTLLKPEENPGKIILIPRLGVAHIRDLLPPLLNVVGDLPVLWVLDPMHGNTIRASSKKKTRRFEDIEQELRLFVEIMGAHNIKPHGLHCEATAEDVTECLDPERFVTEENLNHRYFTGCDPRLNPQQVMALIELCGEVWP